MKAVPYSRHLAFLVIAAVGCLTDLATKRYVFAWLGMPRFDEFKVWWIWEPYFGLQTSTNQGALFGIGQGKVWLFAAASFVAIVGIYYWLFVVGAAPRLAADDRLSSSYGGRARQSPRSTRAVVRAGNAQRTHVRRARLDFLSMATLAVAEF